MKTPLKPSLDEISRRISDCLIAAAWVKPETQVTNTPELFKILNTAAPYEFLNGVYRTQFSAGRAAALIKEHYDSFRRERINFRWYVFPHFTPVNLHEQLRAYNPTDAMETQGFFAPSRGLEIAVPKEVSVEELSAENLEDYATANNDGWGVTGPEAKVMRDEIKKDFEKGNRSFQSFLARFNGEPAGTGILRFVDGFGYLVGGNVRPSFRHQGVYRSLVAHRLRVVEERGSDWALVLARKSTSAPIFHKLGFYMACEPVSYGFRYKSTKANGPA